MSPAVVGWLDAQTLVDAFGLGAVYALMAVGIGLVFGVLRLVNFAYGQLIMAGAYTLAFTSQAGWPTWAGGICMRLVVVILLSGAMDRLVFRPLRTQSPAVMLVTTFAVAFILQNVALLIDVRDLQVEPPLDDSSFRSARIVRRPSRRTLTLGAAAAAAGASLEAGLGTLRSPGPVCPEVGRRFQLTQAMARPPI